jgi:hypothetical protein
MAGHRHTDAWNACCRDHRGSSCNFCWSRLPAGRALLCHLRYVTVAAMVITFIVIISIVAKLLSAIKSTKLYQRHPGKVAYITLPACSFHLDLSEQFCF